MNSNSLNTTVAFVVAFSTARAETLSKNLFVTFTFYGMLATGNPTILALFNLSALTFVRLFIVALINEQRFICHSTFKFWVIRINNHHSSAPSQLNSDRANLFKNIYHEAGGRPAVKLCSSF